MPTWQRHVHMWVFPLLTGLLAIMFAAANFSVFSNPQSLVYTYLNSAQSGDIGAGTGISYNNGISFEGLEEGDIILGGYPGCAYGRFSHAAIYAGDGQIIEGYVDLGITQQSINHFRSYPEICLLRVEVDPAVKQKAVAYVKQHMGDMFYPVAFKPGARLWNCSKIMWKGYAEQGLDLDQVDDLWIAPETFYFSSYVRVIRESGQL